MFPSRAIDFGRRYGEAQLGRAYEMLLPRQRAAIPKGLYTSCVLQAENQGNTPTAEVRMVEDDGDVVLPGYSRPLPTMTVFVTLPGEYNRAPAWYGRLRVTKDAGRWYVSVAAPAFKNYGEGNCEYSIWEYPTPSTDTTLPSRVTVPAAPGATG
jgi:hypothetical protein